MLYRKRALEKARGEIGVKERPAGSNSGFRVSQYQAATSLGGTGWPWCAALVNWAFEQADRPLVELKRSASVPVLLNEAKKLGWVKTVPEPGDLACFQFPPADPTPDHIGFVDRVDGNTLFTIEGNTSMSSDSNGGEVMARIRSMSQVQGLIRVPGRERWRYEMVSGGQVIAQSKVFFGDGVKLFSNWYASIKPKAKALATKGKSYTTRRRKL